MNKWKLAASVAFIDSSLAYFTKRRRGFFGSFGLSTKETFQSCFFISTAESGQLCYTNRCGVVVVGIVVVVGGVVNFLNFDLTIGCLPLI